MALFSTVFGWLSLARHAAYQSHAFDLGNVDQAVWNTAHGSLLRFTDMAVNGRVLTSRLAIHVEPLLVAIAPLFWALPGPRTLLVLQALVVASGALPLYLLAVRVLGSSWVAVAFPLAYLAHPSLQNAVLDDFHAVTFSAAFLGWAIYALWTDRIGLFAVSAVLAAATKEEVGLIAAMLGIWLFLRGRRAVGVGALVGGTGWFLLAVLLIVPHFNPGGQSPYLARYAYLGHGFRGVLTGIVLHPDRVLAALASPDRQAYLLYLTHPLGLVPLLGAPVLLLGLPVLAINLLSADPTMYSGFYQYSAELVPITIAAAILGCAWLRAAMARASARGAALVVPLLAIFVTLGAVTDTWRWGFTPLSLGYVVPAAGPHQALEDRVVASIPKDAVVAAADEIEPHLADRRWVYLLPTVHPRNGPPARFILLDASVPASPFGPSALRGVARRALRSGYGVRLARDGILLLERGAPRRVLPPGIASFAFGGSTPRLRIRRTYGALQLVGATVHPSNGTLNRSRPAIGVETYWWLRRPQQLALRLAVYRSPAYSGPARPFSTRWPSVSESPTLAWLGPPARWPVGRRVLVAFVGLVPPPARFGKIDVWLRVSANGRDLGAVRLGTVTVVP